MPTPKKAIRKPTGEPDFVRQACLAAMIRIEVIKNRIEALDYALNGSIDRFQRHLGDAATATEGLRSYLYREMADAYKDMLMFGVIAGGDIMQEAKVKAYEHYLGHRYSVAHYLNMDGSYTGSYHTEEVELFQAQLDAAIECPENHDGGCDAPITAANLHAANLQLEDSKRRYKELHERYNAVVSEFASMQRTVPED